MKKVEKARILLKKMIREFSKVMSADEMIEKASWFSLASSVKDDELTKMILVEELGEYVKKGSSRAVKQTFQEEGF